MKSDSPQAKKFFSLIKKIKSQYDLEAPVKIDPAIQLAISFLSWNATLAKADTAYASLMEELVDINELRVSLESEVMEIIGKSYPQVDERLTRMRESLNEVFKREHATAMSSIASKGKKEQRAYLDTLPGMVPYVASQVALLSFGAHAIPIDDKLNYLLTQEGILDEGTPTTDVESALIRVVKAADAMDTHLALQAWSDEHRVTEKQIAAVALPLAAERFEAVEPAVEETPVPKKTKAAAKKTSAKKAPAKKAAKKSTTKKTTTKKAATKKTTKKKTTKKKKS